MKSAVAVGTAWVCWGVDGACARSSLFFAVWRDKGIMLTIIRKKAPNVEVIPIVSHLSFIEGPLLRKAAMGAHATPSIAGAVPSASPAALRENPPPPHPEQSPGAPHPL